VPSWGLGQDGLKLVWSATSNTEGWASTLFYRGNSQTVGPVSYLNVSEFSSTHCWDIERPATLVSRDRVSRGGAIPLEEGDPRLLTILPLSRPVQSPVGRQGTLFGRERGTRSRKIWSQGVKGGSKTKRISPSYTLEVLAVNSVTRQQAAGG
jgi:hypothetical protein